MDQESIVYGCIKDVASSLAVSERIRTNREAMLSLPHADEWPFISQEMFAIPQVEMASNSYQTEVMHFGASYKAVEYEWDQWIAQFEALLRKCIGFPLLCIWKQNYRVPTHLPGKPRVVITVRVLALCACVVNGAMRAACIFNRAQLLPR